MMHRTLRTLFALIVCALLLGAMQPTAIAATSVQTVKLANGKSVNWPPQLGQPYPELELVDRTGKIVKLTDFKGKIIILEPIGMTCPACNAFAGGAKKGGFKGMEVERGADAIADYFTRYTGGLSLDDDRIVFISLLLYNMYMRGPTQEDAADWAEHFGLDQKKNAYVLAGGPELIGQASYDMIPGLQLIDQNFILRSDATGHRPHDNMWTTLFPMVPKLLQEKSK